MDIPSRSESLEIAWDQCSQTYYEKKAGRVQCRQGSCVDGRSPCPWRGAFLAMDFPLRPGRERIGEELIGTTTTRCSAPVGWMRGHLCAVPFGASGPPRVGATRRGTVTTFTSKGSVRLCFERLQEGSSECSSMRPPDARGR